MRTERIDLGDVTLDCLVDGPSDGPLALLLHGFPDTRQSFRHLAPELTARGYRVVIPAMRGYAPSTTSASGNYQIAALASDVIALEEHFGNGNTVLIGHDWGSTVAETALKAAPGRFAKGVTIAVPPASVFASLFVKYDQLRYSWYMFFFQSPLADVVVAMDEHNFIARQWADWSPGYDATEDLGYVREALAAPEHLGAALGYYRAMFSFEARDEAHRWIVEAQQNEPTVPVLYLHGRNDGCVNVDLVGDPIPFLAAGSRFEIVENAGHFVQLERPDEVARLVTEWLN